MGCTPSSSPLAINSVVMLGCSSMLSFSKSGCDCAAGPQQQVHVSTHNHCETGLPPPVFFLTRASARNICLGTLACAGMQKQNLILFPAVCKSLAAGHRPSEQASSNPTLTLTTFDVPGLLPHRTSHCPSKAANRPWTALMTWRSHCAVCNAMKDSQGTACPRASSSEVCTILTRLFLIFGCHKISC